MINCTVCGSVMKMTFGAQGHVYFCPLYIENVLSMCAGHISFHHNELSSSSYLLYFGNNVLSGDSSSYRNSTSLVIHNMEVKIDYVPINLNSANEEIKQLYDRLESLAIFA